MGINDTPRSNRPHIAFFGRRNAGKSSVVNAVTGQNLALVSEVKGTTTDPVYKAMELLPLGPVLFIDTPGIDDEGSLGGLRVEKARQVLNKTDAAVLVLDGGSLPAEKDSPEEKLAAIFKEKNIPYIIILNKYDLYVSHNTPKSKINLFLESKDYFPVSAKTGFNIHELKEKIASLASEGEPEQPLVADLVRPGDFVVLVIPIDKAAPKGRLILPQQQVMRGILDARGAVIAVQDTELENMLAQLERKVSLVITDSQVFAKVAALVPPEIPLTSFSILFARYKGFLENAVRGAAALDALQNKGRILICEGCTHHRQCGDIGTEKIPAMIRNFTKKELEFVFCSGGDFPGDISSFSLIIHCGGCMLNGQEIQYRSKKAQSQNIPFSNYGISIAHIQGILERSIAMLSIKRYK